MSTTPRLICELSTTGQTAVRHSDTPRRYRKDIARLGTFYATDTSTGGKAELKIDADRADRIVKSAKEWLANGNPIELTVDHEDRNSAHAVHGQVVDVFRARFDGDDLVPDTSGDRVGVDLDAADDKAEELIRRCPSVSLELDTEIKDGEGRTYQDAVTAVTVCRQPVIGHQKPFQRIAASRGAAGSDTANAVVLHFSADSPASKPPVGPDQPQDTDTMLTAKSLAALTVLGIIKVPEGTKPADVKAEDLNKALEGLDGKKFADPEAAKKLESLDTITKERDTLQGQVDELKKGSAPEVNDDLVDQTAELKQEKLDNTVTAGKLTPAAAKIAASRFIGEAGKRKTICLSRTAAKHAGLENPVFDDMMAVIEANDPVELGKQHSQQQTVHASRAPVHGGDDSTLDDAVEAHNKALA